uniref:Family with sequence similarity 186 member A n=1 Tax=Pseudonaja textilis TaxID=8673 RepID=A0A670ZTN0_PSETE
MLEKVELEEKLIPSEAMIEKMEIDLLKFIEKIEENVRRLIKLFQPLLTEKMKARRKSVTMFNNFWSNDLLSLNSILHYYQCYYYSSYCYRYYSYYYLSTSGQKYALLFKAWRDKVADTPQEGEPLTPEQMLDDESLAFTRCHEVNNMIHELGESSFFNKAEIAALKYTTTMVGNLIKAFSLLVKQCRNLRLKCDSLTIVEGRKQDPQVIVLQRELRMALERKMALEKQVQSAEERCMALLVTNELIQKELHDANEKASLADNITFPRVTSGKPQSKPSDVEKDVKSKQGEKPKLMTEPRRKVARKGEGESLDEKWESQGEDSQWCWNRLKEEHRKQQEIWQEEEKEREIKRRQAHLQQEEQYKQQQKEQQKKQQELEHVWEKRWQEQLQSWQQEMQKQQDQESRDQEQKSKVLEKQRLVQKERKPSSPKLKVVESSVLDIFINQCKMPPVSKEKIISTTPRITPSSSIALKEDSSELETTWFPKMLTKIEELPTYDITEKRYWINVEAQRKNLKLLREASQKAGISPELYNDTKETIKQALHSNVERPKLLAIKKYVPTLFSLFLIHRHSLILQLDTAKEAKDGAKMQNLYKMVDKVDSYQKKLLDRWKVKQNVVEKQHQHCLRKMVDFAQLHLSNPCLLTAKAEDGTKKETFHMPHIKPAFLKSRVYKSPLIRVKKSQDFTQIESLWKTDITELSFPLGPKSPVSFLWSETSGFPDIPRFLELDISSVRGKPLQYMESR